MTKVPFNGHSYINSEFVSGENTPMEVKNKWTQKTMGWIGSANNEQCAQAIDGALQAFDTTSRSSYSQRAKWLWAVHKGLVHYRDKVTECIIAEAGKTREWAKIEVDRALLHLEYGAAFCLQDHGKIVNLSTSENPSHYGVYLPFPPGPVLAFSPFNFPLNLALHKIIPAVAAGCPILLKPSPHTPYTALWLAYIVKEFASEMIHPAQLQVVNCHHPQAHYMLQHPGVPVFSFTGSASVGWNLKSKVPRKKVLLELGGTAPVIIDHSASHLADIARKVCFGAYGYGGQTCISIQHIWVHHLIAEEFKTLLLQAIDDHQNELTGPLIDNMAVERIDRTVNDAIQQGANMMYRSQSTTDIVNTYPMVLLDKVPAHHPLSHEEIFGPVAIWHEFSDDDRLIHAINSGNGGLQVGVFTQNRAQLSYLYQHIQTGGVIANQVPGWRLDHMPYGGVKESGFGKEGVAYAFNEICDYKLLA
jgi:glyceraldehyde-3-phosphate dehydrogenase (NADP+)